MKTDISYTLVKQFTEQEDATGRLKTTEIVNSELIYMI